MTAFPMGQDTESEWLEVHREAVGKVGFGVIKDSAVKSVAGHAVCHEACYCGFVDVGRLRGAVMA
jgi:hypothetical protein